MKKETLWVIIAGLVIGAFAVILQKLGNPSNMGFCIACFERDITGALGLFSWDKGPHYIRPEIIGILLGGFLTAVAYKEFKPKSGSAPATRFLLGMFMMIGALVFLGCPLRMVIRLGGGDLNAILGVVGFIVGVAIGVVFLRQGFNLGRAFKQGGIEAYIMPVFMVLLLLGVLFKPVFIDQGPLILMDKGHVGGSSSPVGWTLGVIISLAAGLLVGFLAQRSRMCFAGGFRDFILIKSPHLLWGVIAVFVAVLIGNLFTGSFGPEGLQWSFEGHNASHSAHLWNFLGMALVGLCAVLLGGCPLRQLVLSGNGNTDSVVTVFGMMAGAAVVHNFSLVSAMTLQGKIAVILALLTAIVIAVVNRSK